MRVIFSGIIFAAFVAGNAAAQDPQAFGACRRVLDIVERLRCYDRLEFVIPAPKPGSDPGVTAAAPPGLRTVRSLDLLVDWRSLIGQRVIVTGGRISWATNESAILNGPGGNLFLRPPWANAEGLRYIFQNCSGLLTGARCDLSVAGDVQRETFREGPQLVNVQIIGAR